MSRSTLRFTALLTMFVFCGLAALGASPANAGKTIKFRLAGDLKILDPIITTSAYTIGHGYLVYDTLFAMNSKFEPQPQMVDTWSVSDDGLRYTFTLRKGMKWHDGTAVTARDAVASLKRWGQKGSDAKAMMGQVQSIEAKNDLTFEMVFKEKFGPVLLTLANPVIPGFIMREKDAMTSPNEPVKEIIGSGPFIFAKDEWMPGRKIVYHKFKEYVPRKEPADGYAGGKIAKVDTVETVIIPDTNTAVQALIAGEIDVMESVPTDLVPLLKASGSVEVRVTNPLGFLGHLRINSVNPPFNNPKARQALLMSIDQDAFNTAVVGNHPEYKKTCWAVFGCDSLFETEVGAEPFINGSTEKAKQLMKEAGYDGRKIVILDPTDWDQGHAYALLAGQALRGIGVQVDVQAMDWSTLSERRSSKKLPGPGSPGWDIFPTSWPTITMSNPITNQPLETSCDKAWYGWPCDKEIERLRGEFVKSATIEEQKEVTRALQKRFYEIVPYVNAGQYVEANAWRSELKGMIPFMQPVYWNVDK